MLMPGRNGGEDQRFGFQGQEMDNEINGSKGTSYTAMFWQYDSRLGRRWNVDPVIKYHESPYASIANNPIWLIDPNGADTTLASKSTGSKNVMIYIADQNEEDDNYEFLDKSGWDYIVTDNISIAAQWMKNNYAAGAVDNLEIRTHSAVSTEGELGMIANYPDGSNYFESLYLNDFKEGGRNSEGNAGIQSMRTIFSRLNSKGSCSITACTMAEQQGIGTAIFSFMGKPNSTLYISHANSTSAAAFDHLQNNDWAPMMSHYDFLDSYGQGVMKVTSEGAVTTNANLIVYKTGGFSVMQQQVVMSELYFKGYVFPASEKGFLIPNFGWNNFGSHYNSQIFKNTGTPFQVRLKNK